MRKRLIVFVSFFFFWMVFFAVARGTFLVYNYSLTSQLTGGEILKSFFQGSKMDMSMTGYFMIITGLLLSITTLITSRLLSIIIHGATVLFLLISVLITTVDLELYRHWGFRMNTLPLFYMGSEAMGTVEFTVTLRLIFFALVLFALFCWVYFRFLSKHVRALQPSGWKSGVVLLIVTLSMALPIRGSVSTSTMNPSMVYFHPTKIFANHAGINVTWNFLYSLQTDNTVQYPEDYFAKDLTQQYFTELYPQEDSTQSILSKKNPNIVLVIMEGITAEVVEPLGGRPGIMPNLHALSREGIFFDHFYANGDRTDKGLVSILSSYPPQPRGSIIKFPQKTQYLSFLSTALEQAGYTTSFVYGGDADFANYRTFLTNGRFNHITSVDDFPGSLDNSKWGVADEFVYEQALQEIDTTKQSFFKVLLMLSSHEPFQVPMETVIKGDDEPAKYMNACYYADKSLGEFMRKAKASAWWKDALVIITTDHGHRLPGHKKSEARERFHIPMIWTGGVITADSVVHKIGNQSDISSTLLTQLGKRSDQFIFSKDLFNANSRNFAMYVYNDGYGFVDSTRYIVYDNPGKQYLRKDGVTKEEDLNFAKAYMQTLYTDYNSKK
jgi:phosphoglycerol transferase MdoB-like AlkP superfamily enzyme